MLSKGNEDVQNYRRVMGWNVKGNCEINSFLYFPKDIKTTSEVRELSMTVGHEAVIHV
jgi:hypothetical protein